MGTVTSVASASTEAPSGPIPGQLPLLGDEEHATTERHGGSGRPGWLNLRNAIIALVVLGLGARLASLGARPLHHDESLDAWFSWRVLIGTYDGYDPVYHGPLRFYVTAAVFWLIGESATTARLLAALSGAAVVALPVVWRRDLGRVGTVAAVALAAISPSLLYFSRVGREDSFFLLLTFLTVIVFVAFIRAPRVWHPTALVALLVAGLAVKESVFITIFVFGAFGMVLLTQELALAPSSVQHTDARHRDVSADSLRRLTLLGGLLLMVLALAWGEPIFRSLGVYGLVLAALLVWSAWDARARGVAFGEVPILRSFLAVPLTWWLTAVWVSILLFIALFTEFFTNFGGAGTESAPYGSIENGLRAGFEYWRGEQDTVRGDARWQYYLAIIPAYEWFALALAAVGIGRVLRRPTLVGQTLIWWGVGSFAVHSWAGERMPWLMIHPLLPFVVLAGIGVQVLWDHRDRWWRVPVAVAGALALAWTLTTAYQAAYVRGGEPQELLVQAGQATPEVPEWVDRLYLLDRLVVAEEGRHLAVSIDSDVYWPYGWYLRDFPTGTFAVLDTDSEAPDSDVIMVPHWEQEAIGGQLSGYTALPYEHRWWWVPDFDVGPGDWARWLWDRRPWDGSTSDPSDCPGSLVGQVYVRDSLYELEQRYLAGRDLEPAGKPGYGGPCQRPDVAALGG